MKKVFLAAMAAMFALAAGAQNKSIDLLVSKYADTDGFTVVNLKGDALKGIVGMIPQGAGSIDLGNGAKIAIDEFIKEIVSVSVIVCQRADEIFALEARGAIASSKYSPLVSHNDEGMSVKLLTADIKRGKLKKNREIVAMISDDDKVVLARVIGKIDTALLTKLAAEIQKKS